MILKELPKRLIYFSSPFFISLQTKLVGQFRRLQLQLFIFINRYWLRLTIVGFFIGVLCLKEVSIELRWQHPADKPTDITASLPDTETKHLAELAMPFHTKVINEKREKQLKYVTRFAKVARAEMKKFGIPASITLAQGLLETNAGDSPLANKLNNHFGIKCFSKKCKKGHCANFSDDTHKDFFRTYVTAWESFRAHSKLLQSKRYQFLYHLPTNDYAAWASGLKKAGYATDPRYPEKLVRLIEDLNLQQYDS